MKLNLFNGSNVKIKTIDNAFGSILVLRLNVINNIKKKNKLIGVI